jgi:DNA-directed RNA polymerase specialized sigma24 family protein
MNTQPHEVANRFPSTSWTEVANLVQASGDERRDALQSMLLRYLPALRSHLQYSRRLPADLSEDVLQAFVTEKILTRNLLAEARRERGRFRAFLIVTLNRFTLNYLRSERSRGRHVQECEDLDAVGQGPSNPPHAAFDVEWARGLLRETLAYMEKECGSRNRRHIWEIFKARTLLPVVENKEPVPYQVLVEQLGYLSPSQAANALITANRMFARILRGMVAMYASSEEEIEEEIRQLHEILASAGAGSGGGQV